MIELKLDHDRNYTWWEKFIETLPRGRETTITQWYELRDHELQNHGARLHHDDRGVTYLIFDTDSCRTMFLMRFS